MDLIKQSMIMILISSQYYESLIENEHMINAFKESSALSKYAGFSANVVTDEGEHCLTLCYVDVPQSNIDIVISELQSLGIPHKMQLTTWDITNSSTISEF